MGTAIFNTQSVDGAMRVPPGWSGSWGYTSQSASGPERRWAPRRPTSLQTQAAQLKLTLLSWWPPPITALIHFHLLMKWEHKDKQQRTFHMFTAESLKMLCFRSAAALKSVSYWVQLIQDFNQLCCLWTIKCNGLFQCCHASTSRGDPLSRCSIQHAA